MCNIREEDIVLLAEITGLTFSQLRQANMARIPFFDHLPDLSDWSVAEWTNALAGEAGEAANFAKKLKRRDGGPENEAKLKAALAKELADVVVYADLCAARLGIDLAEAVRAKFNEVTDRIKEQGKDCKVYL